MSPEQEEEEGILRGDYACNICNLPVCECDRIFDSATDR